MFNVAFEFIFIFSSPLFLSLSIKIVSVTFLKIFSVLNSKNLVILNEKENNKIGRV